MSTETIARLKDAGFPVEGATEDQQSALSTLSDAEVDVLLKVKSMVEETSPEVEGHDQAPGSSGGYFW